MHVVFHMFLELVYSQQCKLIIFFLYSVSTITSIYANQPYTFNKPCVLNVYAIDIYFLYKYYRNLLSLHR